MSFVSEIGTRGRAYAKEINGLNADIKKLKEQKKKLETEKKKVEGYLYQYMKSYGLEEVDGIILKKVTPKAKTITKKKKDKEQDAIDLCREVGIPNPDEFYHQFLSTQKGKKMEMQL